MLQKKCFFAIHPDLSITPAAYLLPSTHMFLEPGIIIVVIVAVLVVSQTLDNKFQTNPI